MAVVHIEAQAAAMTISTEERDFFVALGERIAILRKRRNVTQVQLAEALVTFLFVVRFAGRKNQRTKLDYFQRIHMY